MTTDNNTHWNGASKSMFDTNSQFIVRGQSIFSQFRNWSKGVEWLLGVKKPRET